MKKVLIAGYSDATINYQNSFARLSAAFDTFPSRSEGLPSELCRSARNYDGLVLPGGGDITPELFGAVNQGSRDIDTRLDRLQLEALDAFLEAGKPVLGICKGLQVINVYFGGTIIQDLPEHSRLVHAYDNGDKIHVTKAAKGTFPEQLYGKTPVVNSAHHQGVHVVGDGLLVAQYSRDFVVEALYHEKLAVIGVQWHPERMCFSFANIRIHDGSLLLRYFISLC